MKKLFVFITLAVATMVAMTSCNPPKSEYAGTYYHEADSNSCASYIILNEDGTCQGWSAYTDTENANMVQVSVKDGTWEYDMGNPSNAIATLPIRNGNDTTMIHIVRVVVELNPTDSTGNTYYKRSDGKTTHFPPITENSITITPLEDIEDILNGETGFPLSEYDY